MSESTSILSLAIDYARDYAMDATQQTKLSDASFAKLTAACHDTKDRLAALTAENERLRENEHTLRMGWWLSHGCSGLYGDDGEMQCGQCMIDFKRDDPRDIETRIKNANMLKLASQLVEVKEHG